MFANHPSPVVPLIVSGNLRDSGISPRTFQALNAAVPRVDCRPMVRQKPRAVGRLEASAAAAACVAVVTGGIVGLSTICVCSPASRGSAHAHNWLLSDDAESRPRPTPTVQLATILDAAIDQTSTKWSSLESHAGHTT